MNTLRTTILVLALALPAIAAEPLTLITTLGEHTLAKGLRLIVRERRTDPLEFTIARTFPDGTSTASSMSPLAAPGQPFVFCWVRDRKRLWVASPEATGYVDLFSLVTDELKESRSESTLIHHSTTVPASLVAEMPPSFRDAAAKWFRVATEEK
jgi:hypothetical protein